MASRNGTPSGKFLKRPATAGYVPRSHGYALYYHDGPFFNVYTDPPRMKRDPKIRIGLRMLRAPIHAAQGAVRANSPDVEAFVRSTLKRFWRGDLAAALRVYEYGHAAGEVCYCVRGGRLAYDGLREVHPLDARPLIYKGGHNKGSPAGVRVVNVPDAPSGLDLYPPNSFWLVDEPECGLLYNRWPRLAGAWEPWMEKRGRHGGVDIRRTWFIKNAFRGGLLRYPAGTHEDENGTIISNEDEAQQILEKMETGGVLTLPNTKDPVSGEYLWSYEPPASNGDITGVLDYGKLLDVEILEGLGIPPEMVEAATVGSGYSGRAIPAQMYYGSLDGVVNAIIETVDRQIIHRLVRENFGTGARYEIEAAPLAELLAGDDGEGGDDPDSPGGNEQWQPFAGSKKKTKPPAPPKPPTRMSLELRQRVRDLADERYPVRLAFDENKHPRDDHGQFVSAGDLQAASDDPGKADELRSRVTDPEQRAKLERHLAVKGGADPADTPDERAAWAGRQKQRAARRATLDAAAPNETHLNGIDAVTFEWFADGIDQLAGGDQEARNGADYAAENHARHDPADGGNAAAVAGKLPDVIPDVGAGVEALVGAYADHFAGVDAKLAASGVDEAALKPARAAVAKAKTAVAAHARKVEAAVGKAREARAALAELKASEPEEPDYPPEPEPPAEPDAADAPDDPGPEPKRDGTFADGTPMWETDADFAEAHAEWQAERTAFDEWGGTADRAQAEYEAAHDAWEAEHAKWDRETGRAAAEYDRAQMKWASAAERAEGKVELAHEKAVDAARGLAEVARDKFGDAHVAYDDARFAAAKSLDAEEEEDAEPEAEDEDEDADGPPQPR